MKTAQIQISEELLRQVLCIPEDVYLTGVRHDPFRNQFFLALCGPGLPDACDMPEGSLPPNITPTYVRDGEQEIASGVMWKVS